MKIETGCMAVVINGAMPNDPKTNIGKCVTVGKFLGKVSGFPGIRWEVDRPMNSITGGVNFHSREDWLMRIDGLDEKQKQKEFMEIT